MVHRNWIYVLISLWTLAEINAEDLSIGVIQDGHVTVSRVERRLYNHFNVTWTNHFVDMGNAFQVFRAVRQLDSDDDIDFVVILHHVKLSSMDDHVMMTSHKPLIHWGRTPFSSLQVPKLTQLATTDRQCAVKDGGTPYQDEGAHHKVYCFCSIADMTSLGRGTLLEKVPLTVANIVSSLVTKYLHWTSVYIFHDNSTETNTYELLKQLSARGVLSLAYNVDVIDDVFVVLLEIYNEVKHIEYPNVNGIVLCQFECIRRLLWEVSKFDDDSRGGKTLLKQFSRWLVASYGHTRHVTDTLVTCAHDVDNVAVLALPGIDIHGYNISKHFSRGVSTVLAEYKSMKEEEEEITNGEINFANPQNSYTGTFFEYVTRNLQKQSSVSPCAALQIETLVWREHGREFSNVGYITTDGDVVTFSDLFPNTKYGYNKRRFLVATLGQRRSDVMLLLKVAGINIESPPFVIKSVVNGTPVYEGICMDLLKQLSLSLNFTYNITEPPDQTWGGTPGPNLTFNGMVGQLQREEIDMVAADLAVQKEREQVMDFAYPFMYAYTSVILKKPDPNAGKWKTLLNPFQYPVLVTIGVVLLVASLMAFLFEKYNPFFQHIDNAQLTTSDTYRINTVLASFWYMGGALLCQGGVNLPMTMAGRTFVSFWWLLCLVLFGAYCGNLVAFLTVTKVKAPFNTLQEMAEMKDEYKWGAMAGSIWELVLMSSPAKDIRKVGDLAMEFNRSDPEVMSPYLDVQIAKVKRGGYAFIGDSSVIGVEMAKDCDLMMIKEKFLFMPLAFGFTNNSPHAKIFSKQMLLITESGLIDVWKWRWWPKASTSTGICQDSAKMIEANPISLVDVQSAFYVVAGGGLISTLVFLVEVLVGRRKKLPSHREEQETSTGDNDNNT